MKTILIKNAKTVVTCDAEDHVYHNCDILVQGPAIRAIGQNLPDTADEVIDATGKIGLVNTHHHFFQTFVRNLRKVDYINMEVPEWIDKIYRIFQLVDEEVIYYSSLTAMADLIKHGCTCAMDHQYCFTPGTGKAAVDRQMQAASELGIRYHAGRGVNTLPREDGGSIPENMRETTEEYLAGCERLIGRYHDTSDYSMSQIVMAPCQPINCYPETFIETIDMARRYGVKMHTHLGEGENVIMMERWGKRTLQWCEDIGFVGPDVFVAHAWELTDEEYARMGQLGVGISHCPTPAILGGHEILPLKRLKELNVPVSLGADGSATNDGSSLLDALRTGWMMQAYFSKPRGGCIDPYEMLKIATVGGAQMLGRNDLGSLEVGKGADLFFVDADRLDLTGATHDAKNLLPRTGVTSDVALTMINGKVVWQDGKLLGVDEKKLAREGEAVCNRVLREHNDAYWNLD